jgi:serine/threonine-protein kinase
MHPQSAVATNALGNFYLRQNDYAKGAELFRKVTELAPEGYAGYVNLGVAYTHLHRYPEALDSLKKSLLLRPTYAAYVNIGTVYWNQHDYGQAAANYQEALKINDNQYVTWGNLGEARYYSGAKNEAMTAYRKAADLAAEELKVNPHDTDVLGDLANYYSMMGQRKESLGYLEQAFRYGRNDKQVLAVAAMVHNQFGETGLALEWLSKAVQAGYPRDDLRTVPAFISLSSNPRFQELMTKPQ